MNPIIIAIVFVTIVGLLCAVMLVLASKFMAVEVDDRVTAVRECLPGANCGACGFAGCDGYANALIEDGAAPSLCTPGGAAVAAQIGEILGLEVGSMDKKVAIVACSGNCNATKDKLEYYGLESCAAANLMYGGKGSCTFGCLGLGDCAAVCPENAICIENGIAHIDPRACVGCGLCAKACPKGIIDIKREIDTVVVGCSSTAKPAETRKACTAGCIGCKKCTKVCPTEAITVVNNLAVIDDEKCCACGLCVEVCTTKCIIDKRKRA